MIWDSVFLVAEFISPTKPSVLKVTLSQKVRRAPILRLSDNCWAPRPGP